MARNEVLVDEPAVLEHARAVLKHYLRDARTRLVVLNAKLLNDRKRNISAYAEGGKDLHVAVEAIIDMLDVFAYLL
jgi:hypothetical protein